MMQNDVIEKLADAAWDKLAEMPFDAITLSGLADECAISYADAVLYGGDVTGLIVYKIDQFDMNALRQSRDDFAEDPTARTYEKLLEGLMMRFEVLAPYRAQFSALHDGAKKAPALGAALLHQLSVTVAKLLVMAGDDSTGLKKQARIIGVVGVLLTVRPVWASDEGGDLGLTLKKLDDELKKACEWAVSLRVLSQADIAGASADE